MKECLIAKFTQYPELRELLLGTGDRKLVEHTANDRYWADGGDGTGKNMLGILLMEIRNEFRAVADKNLDSVGAGEIGETSPKILK